MVAQTALDLILPPRCLNCGKVVETPRSLCLECWRPLRFITDPCCDRCGQPFELPAPDSTGPAGWCVPCYALPPRYDRARAALVYDDASRKLVLRLKHADRLDLAPALAGWMARAGSNLLAECDLIVPVPLHRWRLLRRRFNQAAVLALALGRISGKPVVPDLLVRRRATRSQGGMNPAARRRNVERVFAIGSRHRRHVAGRRVLLIDDVHTTGATLDACAVALKGAGAAAVDALTIARVPQQAE